jgi:hypothetical protein
LLKWSSLEKSNSVSREYGDNEESRTFEKIG